jgi:hypothetical protein
MADTVKMVIAIRDSVYSLDGEERIQLVRHFADEKLKLDPGGQERRHAQAASAR